MILARIALYLDIEFATSEKSVLAIMEKGSVNRKDAILEDYRTRGKWEIRHFENQTRCIATSFIRSLGHYRNEDTKKINIMCTKEEKHKRISTVLDICEVHMKFDYDEYMTGSLLEKKRLILETIMLAVRKVADSKKWDIEPFEKVYEQIIEANYVSEWVWKKPKQSPDRKHKAKLFLQHELDEITMSIIVTDNKGNELKRETIITEQPDEWEYSGHLGELKWLDNETVALFHKYNNEKKCLHI